MSDCPQITLTVEPAPSVVLQTPTTPQLSLCLGGQGSYVLITGSRPLGIADFYGIGGTSVWTDGRNVYISGGGGGSGSATYDELTGVSGYLQSQINFSTAGVSALNGLSGSLTLVGLGGIEVSTIGQSILINLPQTGDVTTTQLLALSGWAATTIESTGQNSILYSYGISGNLQFQLDTISSNLTNTGSFLYSSLTGYTGQAFGTYATQVQLSNSGSILYGLIVGESGTLSSSVADTGRQAWQAADNNGINLSGLVANTGLYFYQLITGQSGQAVIDYTTQTQLIQSGATLYSLLVNESGVLTSTITQSGQQAWITADTNARNLSGNLQQTGDNLYQLSTGQSGYNVITYATIANLELTGQQVLSWTTNIGLNSSGTAYQSGHVLYQIITGTSGQASNDYATKAILTQSGHDLYVLLTNESGALASSLQFTGQQNYISLTNNALNLSGQLSQSGATILGQILAVSGGLEMRIFSTGAAAIAYTDSINANLSSSLEQTGQSIIDLITNLTLGTPNSSWQIETGASGIVLKNTPSGLVLRNYNDTLGGDLVVRNLTVQGTQTIAHSTNLSVANQYIYLNQSGVPQDGGIELLRSGDAAASLLWNESALKWAAGLSGSESIIVLSSDTGNFATKSLVQSTGEKSYLDNLALSGFFVDQLALTGIQSSAFTLLVSGVLETNLINTGNATINHTNGIGSIISGNLSQSGATLYNRDSSISGGLQSQIGSTGNLAFLAASGASGVLQVQINALPTNFTVTQTGTILYQLLTGLSGEAVSDYATKIQLTQTGATLFNRDSSISGGLQSQIASTGASSVGGPK